MVSMKILRILAIVIHILPIPIVYNNNNNSLIFYFLGIVFLWANLNAASCFFEGFEDAVDEFYGVSCYIECFKDAVNKFYKAVLSVLKVEAEKEVQDGKVDSAEKKL